jgi:lysyl-tRNA synthetase class II
VRRYGPELNDPIVQRERFAEQAKQKDAGDGRGLLTIK